LFLFGRQLSLTKTAIENTLLSPPFYLTSQEPGLILIYFSYLRFYYDDYKIGEVNEQFYELMKELSYLLPRGFRFVGVIFTGLGTILGIMRFYFDFKPDMFDQKVFAVYSVYLKTRTMKVESNQLIEEIVGLLVILGLLMIAFSREKDENPQISSIRLKAFFISFYINTAFLIFSILFTYGLAFIYMTVLYLVLPLSVYIIAFQILVGIERKKVLV